MKNANAFANTYAFACAKCGGNTVLMRMLMQKENRPMRQHGAVNGGMIYHGVQSGKIFFANGSCGHRKIYHYTRRK
jgi:hypothetical protein